MNVLLAGAHVPHDQLVEMDLINPQMPTVDAAIVIGAKRCCEPRGARRGFLRLLSRVRDGRHARWLCSGALSETCPARIRRRRIEKGIVASWGGGER